MISEHNYSHAAVVVCAGLVASVPPIQQPVFLNTPLPLDSGNALGLQSDCLQLQCTSIGML